MFAHPTFAVVRLADIQRVKLATDRSAEPWARSFSSWVAPASSRRRSGAASPGALASARSFCRSVSGVSSRPSQRSRQARARRASWGRAAIACGFERWPVKTLTDSMAARVNLVPRTTSVRALRRLIRPDAPPQHARVRPAETTTYRVHARLVESKFEDDMEFHLVIADPRTGGTMIVEFPAFSCTRTARPALRGRMRAARLAFIRACGLPSASEFDQLRGTATITGVGFFDYDHGQSGVAPNAIELHPVLGFKGSCS